MRAALARVPAPLRALLGVALVMGLAWMAAVPPLQAPDEGSHVAYVQNLAERHDVPGTVGLKDISTEQLTAGLAANAFLLVANLDARPPWERAARAAFDERARAFTAAQREDLGGPISSDRNPPLGYLPYAVAYRVAGGDFFDRLTAMRVASVLLLLVTVAATWLLAGELLGRDRLGQTAAAGAVALAPMVGFISASVNPDAALFATWTLALWLGVRLLRRGLTPGGALALGVVVGLACLVKDTSYALVPGMLLVLGVAGWRARPQGARALLALAGALAALVALVGGWTLLATASGVEPAAQLDASATGGTGASLSLRELVSYVWQFYLPKLPFQTHFAMDTGELPLYDYWIKGAWGTFGWLEIELPGWVYGVITAACAIVAAGALAALWRARRRVDAAVLAFPALVVAALLAGLHWTEYRSIKTEGLDVSQGRYLLPLAGLGGAILAAALRALPARARPAAAWVALGALLTLSVFSLGITLERFYA